MPTQSSSVSRKSNVRLVRAITLIVCFLIIPALLLLLAWVTPALAQTPKRFDELTFEPLPELQIPEYRKETLDNGMTVYLMEDHDLPLVSGQAWIRTGSRLEPAEKVGLASITGEVVRSGGTQTHTADDLNQMLEQRAASVEVGIGESAGQASFSTLTEDLDTVFGLFAEVLTEPALPQDKIDLAKKQRFGAIERRNDSPDNISSREFQRLIYGGQSPYARIQEYDSISNISQADVQQ
ncbi:MAG: insulinase family protein, partial [Cyanobacteria bacterium P01_F01_bin.42]